MTNNELSQSVRNYLELEGEIKARQVIADAIKDEIKKEMDTRGVEELEVD